MNIQNSSIQLRNDKDCELRNYGEIPNPKSEIQNPKFPEIVDRKHRTVSAQIGFGLAQADPTGQGRQLFQARKWW